MDFLASAGFCVSMVSDGKVSHGSAICSVPSAVRDAGLGAGIRTTPASGSVGSNTIVTWRATAGASDGAGARARADDPAHDAGRANHDGEQKSPGREARRRAGELCSNGTVEADLRHGHGRDRRSSYPE